MARSERQRNRASNDNATAEHDDCSELTVAAPEVESLDFAGQFLVWGLRNWVRAFKNDLDFGVVTEGTFARFGLAESAAAIDRTMTLLAASTQRCIDIRCVNCRYLSPDELLLLDAVAAAQESGFFLATVSLRKLVPGTAARTMLPHLVDLARDLHAAGMRLKPVAAATMARAQSGMEALRAAEAMPRPALLH